MITFLVSAAKKIIVEGLIKSSIIAATIACFAAKLEFDFLRKLWYNILTKVEKEKIFFWCHEA